MKHTEHQSVMSVYGKAHLLYPSSSTFSTHVTKSFAGQVKCHYQDSMTSIWKTSKITTDVIMKKFKESTETRLVPIRSYVYILRETLLSTTGTGPYHTPVPYTLPTTSLSSPSPPKLFSRMGIPKLIPRSRIFFEKSMNVSMALFSNIEKLSKICVKPMLILCKNDVFTCLGILCYASNMLLYDSATLMGLTVLVYILMLL